MDFGDSHKRTHTDGMFSREEVRLANRNAGILLETLRHREHGLSTLDLGRPFGLFLIDGELPVLQQFALEYR